MQIRKNTIEPFLGIRDRIATGDAVVWIDEQGEQQRLSYEALHQEVKQRAAYFSHDLKIKPDDVVAVLAPRGPEYLKNLLALWQVGAIYLPLSDAWEMDAMITRLHNSTKI